MLTAFGRVWYGAFDMRGFAAFPFADGQSIRRVPFTGRYWWWSGCSAEGVAV